MLAAAIGAIPLATFEGTESIPLTAPYLRGVRCENWTLRGKSQTCALPPVTEEQSQFHTTVCHAHMLLGPSPSRCIESRRIELAK
jgi:hypothetical protein